MKQKDVLWVRRGSVTKCDRDDRDDRDDGDERTTRQIRTRFPNAVRSLVYVSACPLVRLSACPVSSVPLLSLKRQKRQKRLKGSRYQRRCPSHPFGPYRPYVYRGAEATNFGVVKKKNPRRSCSTRVFSTQRTTFFRTNSWMIWNVYIVSVSISLHLKSRGKRLFLRKILCKGSFFSSSDKLLHGK